MPFLRETLDQTALDPRVLVGAYADWVEDRTARGATAYLLSFMFNPLSGTGPMKAAQMRDEIERVYAKHLTRLFRDPRKMPVHSMPLWIVAPDWPVPKRMVQIVSDFTVNGGLHMHGIAIMPPGPTRLSVGLDQHLLDCQDLYAGPGRPLARIKPIEITDTPGYVTGYVLKSLTRFRAGSDDVLILPRTHGEMPGDRGLSI